MRFKSYGRIRPRAGVMNRNEQNYARHLELLKHEKKILWYSFEGIKLRLADKTFFTVDFFCLNADGQLVAKEVKGRSGKSYWCLDDAKAKVKLAAEIFPFQFSIVWNDKGLWKEEEV
jgi:hypothetical protein